jgi:hypothetical protein
MRSSHPITESSASLAVSLRLRHHPHIYLRLHRAEHASALIFVAPASTSANEFKAAPADGVPRADIRDRCYDTGPGGLVGVESAAISAVQAAG